MTNSDDVIYYGLIIFLLATVIFLFFYFSVYENKTKINKNCVCDCMLKGENND
jgi:hypothetical protein